MAITAEELGRIVGCSTATVSRALNNTGPVAPETREAIYRTLRETKYVPQRATKRNGLSKGGKNTQMAVEIIYHRHSPMEQLSVGSRGLTVGPLNPISPAELGLRTLGDSFWREILDGAVAELGACGYAALLRANVDFDDPQLLADFNAPGKSGILVVGEPSPSLNSLIQLCRYPLVLADIVSGQAHDVVTTDNIAGIGMAFDHVYGLGHRKIGFVGRHDANFAYAERFVAFKMKMAEADLHVRPEWVHTGFSHIEETAETMQGMLSLADRPTALLCSNDCVAIGTLRAASALSLRVPEDVSVVGYDGIDASTIVTPPLTTIRVPMKEIGQLAVRLLYMQMQLGVRTHHRGCRMRLVPELIVRGSTAPATKGITSRGNFSTL